MKIRILNEIESNLNNHRYIQNNKDPSTQSSTNLIHPRTIIFKQSFYPPPFYSLAARL